jgi:cell division protein FtsW
MAWLQRCHPGILAASLLLTGFGIVVVYSASAVVGMERHDDPYFFLRRQGLSVLVGLVAMVVVIQVDYQHLQRWARWGLLATALCLILVYVPVFAKEVGGARRWLQIGRWSCQPAEFAKLTLILYLAHRLTGIGQWRGRLLSQYLSLAAVIGLLFGLTLMQPDLGTAMLLVGIAAIMLFIGGVPRRYLLGSGLALLPLLTLMLVRVGFRWRRLLAFWDPWAWRSDAGFQVVQSLLAFGKGGLTGVGPGAGKQKLFFLPEAHTDFVLAVIGEEFGFIGCLFVLTLFGVILWSGLAVAWRTPDPFARQVASGITSMILLQAIMNVAVVVGVLPTKGLPLPFISFGGSSLVVMLTATGLLLGISARTDRPKTLSHAVIMAHSMNWHTGRKETAKESE